MIEAVQARHSIIYRDEYAYCAHPHAVVSAGGTWIVVFNRAPRRTFVLHPPEDPYFRNVIIRSEDMGDSWSAPQVVPGYDFSGTECAGLTPLAGGGVLLTQWRFDWYPLDLALRRSDQSGLTYPEVFMKGWAASPEHEVAKSLEATDPRSLAPWVRGGGQTWIHRSDDDGGSFAAGVGVDTGPFSGGYCLRSGAELADGSILLMMCDVPNYRCVFSIRSTDGGRSWSEPSLVATGEGHEFEEPAIAVCRSGRLVTVMRDNVTRRLHQTTSDDAGWTWSPARELPVAGYPPHLLALGDGRLLLTYGWRQPDFGVRAVFSEDEGDSWDTERMIHIRGGLGNRNLGYPSTINSHESELFTVYYGEDHTGCACIMGTSWRLH